MADFGIARAVDQAGGGRLTTTGVTLGTPLNRHPPDAVFGDWGTGHTWQAYRLYGERKADSLLALIARTPEPALDMQITYLPTAL